MRLLPKAPISTLRSGPNTKPESSSAGYPILFLQQNRAQPLILSDRLPKAILNPWTPQNTPVDMVQPSRKTRPSSIHQNTGTSSPSHENFTRVRVRVTRGKETPVIAGDVRDAGSIPRSGRFPGGGHLNSWQYSCLENPMDRGTWGITVHRVAKSWTWLKWLSTA